MDRGIYTNNTFIDNVINSLHSFITSFDRGTLNIRIIDDVTAKLHINLTSYQGYRRTFDFDCPIEDAKIFIQAYESDTTQKVYRYHIRYEDKISKVFQYQIGEVQTPIVTYTDNPSDQLIVVQEPIVSGPNIIKPLEPINFVATSKILSKETSAISNFIVTFAGNTISYDNLPNSKAASISFNLSIPWNKYKTGDQLILLVTAVDTKRNYSVTCEKYITVYAGEIITPVILKPLNSSYVSKLNFEVVGSNFSTIHGYSPEHISTDYKICSDKLGNNIIWQESISGANITFNVIPKTQITEGTYYLFIRYEDKYMGKSKWSDYCVIAVDDNFVAEKVRCPNINCVVYVNKSSSYNCKFSSLSLVDTTISSFNLHDDLTGIDISIPAVLIDSSYEAEYNFIVPNTAEIFILKKKEYVITINAVDLDGNKSFNTYLFLRVTDFESELPKTANVTITKLE
jgi:CYTH domain-containing protein